MIEAYPLQWPAGYKRNAWRISSQFKQTMEKAQRLLRIEISRIGGTGLIVSTNIPVRKDGLLYSDWMRKKIDDPGVAIYFKYKGKDISMCCDQYEHIWENIYALSKGIEALRGMDRWGVSDFLERAFTGFKALPESTMSEAIIWQVLGLKERPATKEKVTEAYKAQAKLVHPDIATGSQERFVLLQEAYKKALQFFNNT